jgi:hypothetical protein
MRAVSCHAQVSFEDAMRKPGVSCRAVRKRQRPSPSELSSAAEGQIEEICHDLAVQVKRMKQLEEQAQELRTTLRQRTAPSARQSQAGRTD